MGTIFYVGVCLVLLTLFGLDSKIKNVVQMQVYPIGAVK